MNQTSLLDPLERMQEAATKALGYVAGLDRTAFLASSLVQEAVVMNLIVLGEAATRLMDEHPAFVLAHPLVPWRGIRGMRNRVAHGYFSLDFATAWGNPGAGRAGAVGTPARIAGRSGIRCIVTKTPMDADGSFWMIR